MGMLKEFKEFAVRGNVVDMAVGIVIGGAFGKIVTSLVNDVVMPPVGWLTGKVDFSELGVTLPIGTAGGDAVVIKLGAFLNTIIDFAIVAFAIFLLVKAVNQLRRGEEAKPAPAPTAQEKLLAEIRDLLKARA